MQVYLAFTEEFRYPDDSSGITIPVRLSHGEKTLAVWAKVDTGGEVCLFSNEIGSRLGLQVEQGILTTLDSLGGPVEAFGHEVVIQTGDLIFESLVYFAKFPNLPRNILGRHGWLRKLRMAVVDYDNLLFLNAYGS